MADHGYHCQLNISNFTAFNNCDFEFVSGINAFIGENGTGKTHIMKALYAFQLACFRLYASQSRGIKLGPILEGVFQTQDLNDLVRFAMSNRSISTIEGKWGLDSWSFGLQENDRSYTLVDNGVYPSMPRPVFIPAIDMMGHTRRFLSTYDEHQIDFAQTHRDVVALLLSPERKDTEPQGNLLNELTRILGGEIEEENERFYLRTPKDRLPMPLVAEGLRKIATLHQLIRNGWLEPGGILFWDEPEVNINPILMDEIVNTLVALSKQGIQVFIATHSYIILKELDLKNLKNDELRYFSFDPTDDGTQVFATDDYADLNPNPIARQFDRLYDLELDRATGRNTN